MSLKNVFCDTTQKQHTAQKAGAVLILADSKFQFAKLCQNYYPQIIVILRYILLKPMVFYIIVTQGMSKPHVNVVLARAYPYASFHFPSLPYHSSSSQLLDGSWQISVLAFPSPMTGRTALEGGPTPCILQPSVDSSPSSLFTFMPHPGSRVAPLWGLLYPDSVVPEIYMYVITGCSYPNMNDCVVQAYH